MNYSVVIPVHNEAQNIHAFVVEFVERLSAEARSGLLEILPVENGSNDGTMAELERLGASMPEVVRPMTVARPSYGAAMKSGILAAKGRFVFVLECDVLDASFVERAFDLLKRGAADFVIASKMHPDSVDARPWKRRLLTRCFNTFLRIRFGYPGTETHGLKAIDTVAAKRLCELAQTTDEVFQTEVVLLAWRLGYRIEEVPLELHERRPTPVRIAKRMPMFFNIIRELRGSLARFPRKTGIDGPQSTS